MNLSWTRRCVLLLVGSAWALVSCSQAPPPAKQGGAPSTTPPTATETKPPAMEGLKIVDPNAEPKMEGPKAPAKESVPAEPTKTEPTKTEPTKTEPTKTEAPAKSEAPPAPKPEPAKEPAKTEAPKETPKSEPAKEPAKEAPKDEPKKVEPPKLDAPKNEPAKEAPKSEPAKEPAKTEPKKEDAPKSEPAKDAPKDEPKKDDAPKTSATSGATATVALNTGAKANDKPLWGKGDWNQWGGSSFRNNTPEGKNITADFELGDFDDETGAWDKTNARHILWVAPLGSQTYGNPVIANGKVYVGTNNGHGYMKRYPPTVDLGCLVCFDEKTGKFLWQHSSEKLPTGRVHDWPLQGICCSPFIEGDRLWFVTSRGEVRCLDTEGFYDNKNNGPYTEEKLDNAEDAPYEADVIWSYDMMKDLGVSQHNMCSCSVTVTGDTLWVCTSNGVDESHINLPAPRAPSFIAMDKNTGKVLWTDASPGDNILHGQWSSPAFAILGNTPQVMFAGGDAWIYSFLGDSSAGKAQLLWEFDANPKESVYILGGRGTRNEIIATPVVYDNKVYLPVGQDPEHGEGIGHLWCIDPTKRGDISAELAVKLDDRSKIVPKRRLKALEDGEIAIPNPNSGVIWHYSEYDQNGDGKIDFEETMHRTIGTVVIKDDLLYVPDFSGLVHCVDAQTGKPYWTHDLFAATWGSALVVDGKVYVGDEEGKLTIFKHGKEKEIIAEIDMKNSIYSSPVVANNVLFISNKTHLFAIQARDE